MFTALLVVFAGFARVLGQSGMSCGTGFVFNTAASSCIPLAPSTSCCDASLASCQDAIKLCMAAGGAAGPAAGANCQALACPTPMPSPTCCDPSLLDCQIVIRTCLTNNPTPQVCQMLACPTVSASPIRTQSQYSATATARSSPNAAPIVSSTVSSTSKQADISATTTYKQTDSSASASNTPKQAVDATASASNTPKQAVDATASASNTPKQAADSSASAKPADPLPSATSKPTPSVYPTRFIKYSFSIRPRPSQYVFPTNAPPPTSVSASILFPKANHTLLRNPTKLQELQIILACVLRLPLESIEITDIAANSVSLPFDASIPRLNSNGEIVCITLPPVSSSQGAPLRSLQTSDITVTYNILNANNLFLVDKATFASSVATDPNMLSYASSVGSNTPTAIPPYMLFTIISPDPSTAPAPPPSAGQIVGGIFGGILVTGLLGFLIFAVVRFRHRSPPITAVKKPSVKVSNPLNYTHDTHAAFHPVPTRRTT